jgi:23S rRNA (guanosine2251-2'-O)-methyltransferase
LKNSENKDTEQESKSSSIREWVIGCNPVYEVFRAHRRRFFRLWLAHGTRENGRIGQIIKFCQEMEIPLEWVPRNRIEVLGGGHQGVALEVGGYPYSDLMDIFIAIRSQPEPAFLLLLDVLQDPQNLGALLRTAECVGVDGVLLPLRQTATVTPAVVSSSSGACEHLMITKVNLAQAIARLKEIGIWIVGLDSGKQAASLEKVRLGGPIALVVGGEGKGMRALIRDSCDFLLRLPMRGRIESLNAAVAGSIALYLIWQARGFGKVG